MPKPEQTSKLGGGVAATTGNGDKASPTNVGSKTVTVVEGFQPMSRFEKFVISVEGRLPACMKGTEQGEAFLAKLMTYLFNTWKALPGQSPEHQFGAYFTTRFGIKEAAAHMPPMLEVKLPLPANST